MPVSGPSYDEHDCDCRICEEVRENLLEAVEVLRECGPSANPNAWHAIMERIDPEYGAPGTPGEARRALRPHNGPYGNHRRP